LAALGGFLGASVGANGPPWSGGAASPASPEVAVTSARPLAPPSAAERGAAVVPAPRPLARQEQRYADALWSIHTQVEQSIARVGLGTAFYRSQEIDRTELRSRLIQGLDGYRLAMLQIQALDPPPTLRTTHEGYLAAVRLFQQSALEMLRMYDDGDEEHLSLALPLSLDGTSKLREIGGQFWPETYPAS
jgi:hypothetical protein